MPPPPLPPAASRAPQRGPARVGQPASSRNFQQSSASGAASTSASTSFSNGLSGVSGGERGATELSEVERRKKAAWGDIYMPEEDSLRQDCSSHYVETGERPQNQLRGADVASRFSEYPKLAALLAHKHALLSSPSCSIPPTFQALPDDSLPSFLTSLACLSPPKPKFDVILLSPPPSVTYEELLALDIARLASSPGFVWLWVGSGIRGDGVGLERGRELLAAWGYRRCEDIVWLKTNKRNPSADLTDKVISSSAPSGSREEISLTPPPSTQCDTLFRPTIEHCLMGIRGTVRRSTDPWFVHCNVDTDVIVWEGDELDPGLKPPELQSLIENFCLGTRRLHLYGSPHSLRRGWLTVGPSFAPLIPTSTSPPHTIPSTPSDISLATISLLDSPSSSNLSPIVRPVEGEDTQWKAREYDAEEYRTWFVQQRDERFGDAVVGTEGGKGVDLGSEGGEDVRVGVLLPFVEELDALRPKSPPLRNGVPSSGGLGRGRGAGLGVTHNTSGGGGGMGPNGRGRGGLPTTIPNRFQLQQPFANGQHTNNQNQFQYHQQQLQLQQFQLQLQLQQQQLFYQQQFSPPNLNPNLHPPHAPALLGPPFLPPQFPSPPHQHSPFPPSPQPQFNLFNYNTPSSAYASFHTPPPQYPSQQIPYPHPPYTVYPAPAWSQIPGSYPPLTAQDVLVPQPAPAFALQPGAVAFFPAPM